MNKLCIIVMTGLMLISASTGWATLLGYWSFDNSGNPGLDDSGNGNDGTVYGATWITPGKIGGALSFDGSNDYVNVPNNSSQQITTNQITLAVWIRLNADVGNTQRRIIHKQEDYGIAWGLEMFGDGYGGSSGNQVNFHDSDGGDVWRNCLSTTDLNLNQWYHVAVTDNAGIVRLYINGELDASFDNGYGIPSNINAPIIIGTGTPTRQLFNGLIDEVRFYDRALSDSEIKTLVPEPATVLLLGLGSLALRLRSGQALLRKRRA